MSTVTFCLLRLQGKIVFTSFSSWSLQRRTSYYLVEALLQSLPSCQMATFFLCPFSFLEGCKSLDGDPTEWIHQDGLILTSLRLQWLSLTFTGRQDLIHTGMEHCRIITKSRDENLVKLMVENHCENLFLWAPAPRTPVYFLCWKCLELDIGLWNQNPESMYPRRAQVLLRYTGFLENLRLERSQGFLWRSDKN